MSSSIPEEYTDLFEKKSFANIASVMPDGSPHVTPVWIDYDGENLIVNTSRGRVKERNMSERRKVAISIQDPDNPYRYIGIRGSIVEGTEEGAKAHIDKQAKKYMDVDNYPWLSPGEVRVMFKIKPEKVFTQG